MGKSAQQDEARSYTEFEVYMQQVHGGKERVLTEDVMFFVSKR